jgi:hypothetical protein
VSIRDERFRLGSDGQLFDMHNDPGQRIDVSEQYGQITSNLAGKLEAFRAEVLDKRPEQDNRPFIVGHPDFAWSHLSAGDGEAHGGIQWSNRWPNDSFFTAWSDEKDYISWDVEVVEPGVFEIEIFYTLAQAGTGGLLQVSATGESISTRLIHAHDPPLTGMEHDRVPREESYVKDWKRGVVGQLHLNQGAQEIRVSMPEIRNSQGIDFRLLVMRSMGNFPK